MLGSCLSSKTGTSATSVCRRSTNSWATRLASSLPSPSTSLAKPTERSVPVRKRSREFADLVGPRTQAARTRLGLRWCAPTRPSHRRHPCPRSRPSCPGSCSRLCLRCGSRRRTSTTRCAPTRAGPQRLPTRRLGTRRRRRPRRAVLARPCHACGGLSGSRATVSCGRCQGYCLGRWRRMPRATTTRRELLRLCQCHPPSTMSERSLTCQRQLLTCRPPGGVRKKRCWRRRRGRREQAWHADCHRGWKSLTR
mmetsp:Transcript_21541/g.50697  ORF Transcript_21541/g.50697 Transcript_21541/m.50697 type:complete len:252 (+) Transcript_21541:2039-2794(+)